MFAGIFGWVVVHVFLVKVAFCSNVFEYVEIESFRGKLGNISSLERYDIMDFPTTCWRICQRNPQCVSYFENSVARECYLSTAQLSEDDAVDENGWRYFVKTVLHTQDGADCPADIGYTFDDVSKLCIKLMTVGKMYRAQALANCSQDGGRILQIKNENQQTFLVDYMQTFYPGNSPLIDGSRPNNLGTWRFEGGEALNYFKWANSEPAPSKFCIRISKGQTFNWTAAFCSVKNLYLCEIPMH